MSLGLLIHYPEGGLEKFILWQHNYQRKLYNKVQHIAACHLLKSGVAAIFGPQSG